MPVLYKKLGLKPSCISDNILSVLLIVNELFFVFEIILFLIEGRGIFFILNCEFALVKEERCFMFIIFFCSFDALGRVLLELLVGSSDNVF